MKNTRKLVSLTLAVAIAVLFSGCAAEAGNSAKNTSGAGDGSSEITVADSGISVPEHLAYAQSFCKACSEQPVYYCFGEYFSDGKSVYKFTAGGAEKVTDLVLENDSEALNCGFAVKDNAVYYSVRSMESDVRVGCIRRTELSGGKTETVYDKFAFTMAASDEKIYVVCPDSIDGKSAVGIIEKDGKIHFDELAADGNDVFGSLAFLNGKMYKSLEGNVLGTDVSMHIENDSVFVYSDGENLYAASTSSSGRKVYLCDEKSGSYSVIAELPADAVGFAVGDEKVFYLSGGKLMSADKSGVKTVISGLGDDIAVWILENGSFYYYSPQKSGSVQIKKQ